MVIESNELRMFNRFHEQYFDLERYRSKDRPNIEKFVISDSCNSELERKKLLLSLYTFNFWRHGYCIKRPKEGIVILTFQKYR